MRGLRPCPTGLSESDADDDQAVPELGQAVVRRIEDTSLYPILVFGLGYGLQGRKMLVSAFTGQDHPRRHAQLRDEVVKIWPCARKQKTADILQDERSRTERPYRSQHLREQVAFVAFQTPMAAGTEWLAGCSRREQI